MTLLIFPSRFQLRFVFDTWERLQGDFRRKLSFETIFERLTLWPVQVGCLWLQILNWTIYSSECFSYFIFFTENTGHVMLASIEHFFHKHFCIIFVSALFRHLVGVLEEKKRCFQVTIKTPTCLKKCKKCFNLNKNKNICLNSSSDWKKLECLILIYLIIQKRFVIIK